MEKHEKLDILIDDFNKLEESQKDNIRNLTQKLAVIHNEACLGRIAYKANIASIADTNCNKGVLT